MQIKNRTNVQHMERDSLYIQYGAGQSCPEGWVNFDVSPTLRIQKILILGRFLPKKQQFPDKIHYGNILKGLPINPKSAAGVYASHVLEHLSLEDFYLALRNTAKILRPGGIFRCVLPDLATRAQHYIAAFENNEPDANIKFLKSCCLGKMSRPRNLMQLLREIIGNSSHLWMWDEPSLSRALQDAGYVEIRRCNFGDSEDPMFSRVEEFSRFIDTGYEPPIRELAFEAKRPFNLT